MGGNEQQQVLDGFAKQKGEAKHGLYRNAAIAAQYAKKNRLLLFVVMALLALIIIENKWLSAEQEQTSGLKVQAAEHLAIISKQQQHIDTLRQHKEECDERELTQLKKNRQFGETNLVFKGVLFDEPNYYIEAQSRNEYRQEGHYGEPHKFTFSQWHVAWRARIIDQCIVDKKVNSLRWFARQDGWQLVSEKRRIAAALVLAKETETATND